MKKVKVIIESTLQKSIEIEVPGDMSIHEANSYVNQKVQELIENNDPSVAMSVNDTKTSFMKLSNYPIWINLAKERNKEKETN